MCMFSIPSLRAAGRVVLSGCCEGRIETNAAANLRHVRTGINPRAIPTKPTKVGYPASAGFVRVARRFTVVWASSSRESTHA